MANQNITETQTPQTPQGSQGVDTSKLTRYTDGVAKYTFNGKNYNTQEEAVAARETYKAAVNADWISVGKDRAKYDALVSSGRALSQMSDEELGFIRDRYANSDISKRKAYTNSGTDAYLYSMGLPSAKEIDSYRQKYIDYLGNGGMEQYPELVDKDGNATDATKWIYAQWKNDSTAGLGGVPITKDGKPVKYEDTYLDEQLKSLGLPPSSKLNEYYVRYMNSDKEAVSLSQYKNLFQPDDDGVLNPTDALQWIVDKWGESTTTGPTGNLLDINSRKEVKYEDTVLDQQLKALGLPPSKELDKYYVDYEEEKRINELRDELYTEVYAELDSGKDVSEILKTKFSSNPKYAELGGFLSEPVKFPDPADDAYHNGNGDFDKDFEAAKKAFEKREAMPWRISSEDFGNYIREHPEKFIFGGKEYENVVKWETTPATTEADKKLRNEELNAYSNKFNSVREYYGANGAAVLPVLPENESVDYSELPYYKMLDLGVPAELLYGMYDEDGNVSISGVAKIQDYAKEQSPTARTDIEFALSGKSSSDYYNYEKERQASINTYKITGDARFKKYYDYDSNLIDNQKDAAGNLNGKGAVYSAINGQEATFPVNGTNEEKDVYNAFINGMEGEEPLMNYMSQDEKNCFNVMFRLDPDSAISYLSNITSNCLNRRLISETSSIANALKNGVKISEQEAKNYSYDTFVSAVTNEIKNDTTYTQEEKDAWDKYRFYTVEALEAELAKTPKMIEFQYSDKVPGDYGTAANPEYEEIKFVLDIKRDLDTRASVSANLLYYTEDEGKEAAKNITEKDLEGSKYGDMLRGIYDVKNYGKVSEGKERVPFQKSKYKASIDALTEEEKNQYYWLALNNSVEAADQFMELTIAEHDKELASQTKGLLSSVANENGWYKYAATQVHTVMLSYTALSSTFGTVGALLAGETPSALQTTKWNAGNIITDSVSENLNPFLSFLYGEFVSMQDSAVAAVTSGATLPFVGGAMLGGSAYASALFEGYERGLDPKQAITTAAFAGAFEMLFESLSIDKLLGNLEAVDMPVIKRALIQAGVEGTEEFNTEVANIVMDFHLNGNKSKYEQQRREYIKEGYSKDEADRLVSWNIAGDLSMATVGGMFSGGFMTATGSAGDIPRDIYRWRTTPKVSLQVQTTKVKNKMDKEAVFSFKRGSQFIGNTFGDKTLNDVAFAVNSGKIDKDNVSKVSEALRKIDTTNDAYGYIYGVSDENGNPTMNISEDEFNALSTSIAAYLGDGDVNDIGLIFDMMMASSITAEQRSKYTNYDDIKNGQEVYNSVSQIENTIRSREKNTNKKNDLSGEISKLEELIKASKQNVADITNQLATVEKGSKEEEALLSRQKKLQEDGDRYEKRLSTAKVSLSELTSAIKGADDEIKRQSNILLRHYTSVTSLISEVAPNAISNRSARSVLAENKRIERKIGVALDEIMNSNASEEDKNAAMERARNARAMNALRYERMAESLKSRKDRASFSEIADAIQSKTLKDQAWFAVKKAEEEQAPEAPKETQEQAKEQKKEQPKAQEQTPAQEEIAVPSEEEQAQAAAETSVPEQVSEEAQQSSEEQKQAESPSQDVKQETAEETETEETVEGYKIPKDKKAVRIPVRMQEDFTKFVKDVFGIDLVWGSLHDERTGHPINGRYNIKDKTKIYLNPVMVANKSAMADDVVASQIMAHEVLHWVHETPAYADVYSAAREYSQLRNEDPDETIQKFAKKNGYSLDVAQEEFTAYFVQNVLFGRNYKFAMRVLNNQKHNAALASIMNFVDFVIAEFKLRQYGDAQAIFRLMNNASLRFAKAVGEQKIAMRKSQNQTRNTNTTQVRNTDERQSNPFIEDPFSEEETDFRNSDAFSDNPFEEGSNYDDFPTLYRSNDYQLNLTGNASGDYVEGGKTYVDELYTGKITHEEINSETNKPETKVDYEGEITRDILNKYGFEPITVYDEKSKKRTGITAPYRLQNFSRRDYERDYTYPAFMRSLDILTSFKARSDAWDRLMEERFGKDFGNINAITPDSILKTKEIIRASTKRDKESKKYFANIDNAFATEEQRARQKRTLVTGYKEIRFPDGSGQLIPIIEDEYRATQGYNPQFLLAYKDTILNRVSTEEKMHLVANYPDLLKNVLISKVDYDLFEELNNWNKKGDTWEYARSRYLLDEIAKLPGVSFKAKELDDAYLAAYGRAIRPERRYQNSVSGYITPKEIAQSNKGYSVELNDKQKLKVVSTNPELLEKVVSKSVLAKYNGIKQETYLNGKSMDDVRTSQMRFLERIARNGDYNKAELEDAYNQIARRRKLKTFKVYEGYKIEEKPESFQQLKENPKLRLDEHDKLKEQLSQKRLQLKKLQELKADDNRRNLIPKIEIEIDEIKRRLDNPNWLTDRKEEKPAEQPQQSQPQQNRQNLAPYAVNLNPQSPNNTRVYNQTADIPEFPSPDTKIDWNNNALKDSNGNAYASMYHGSNVAGFTVTSKANNTGTGFLLTTSKRVAQKMATFGTTENPAEVEEFRPAKYNSELIRHRRTPDTKSKKGKQFAFLGQFNENSINDVDDAVLFLLNSRTGGAFSESFRDSTNKVNTLESVFTFFRGRANIAQNLKEEDGKVVNVRTNREVEQGGQYKNATDYDTLLQNLYVALDSANKIRRSMSELASAFGTRNASVMTVTTWLERWHANINNQLAKSERMLEDNRKKLEKLHEKNNKLNNVKNIEDVRKVLGNARSEEEIKEIYEREKIAQAEYYLKKLAFNLREVVMKSDLLSVLDTYMRKNFKRLYSYKDNAQKNYDIWYQKELNREYAVLAGDENLEIAYEDSFGDELGPTELKDKISKWIPAGEQRIEDIGKRKVYNGSNFYADEFQYADKYTKEDDPFHRDIELDVGEIPAGYDDMFEGKVNRRFEKDDWDDEKKEITEKWKEFNQPKDYKGNLYFNSLTGKAAIGSLQEIYKKDEYDYSAYYKIRPYAENPLVIDLDRGNVNAIDANLLPEEVLKSATLIFGHMPEYNISDVAVAATKVGYDSVNVRNATGVPGTTESVGVYGTEKGSDTPADFVATFSPSQNKSIYADNPTFNEDMRNSSWDGLFDEVPEDIRNEAKRKIERSKRDFGIQNRNDASMMNDIETPKRVGEYREVSKSAQRIKETRFTDQATRQTNKALSDYTDFGMASDFYSSEDGKYLFVKNRGRNAKEATEYADGYIRRHNGITQATKDLTETFETGHAGNLTAQIGAAERILSFYGQNGIDNEDLYLVNKFIAQYAIVLTEWGRQGRVMQLIKNTPIAREMYWKSVVSKINKRFDFTANRGMNRIVNKNQQRIEVPQSYYDAIRDASSHEELSIAEDNLTRYLGERAPLTLADMWRNWRYFCMLTNPVTHARNLMGNTGMLGIRTAKDAVAAGLENVAVMTGLMSQDERTHSTKMFLGQNPENVQRAIKQLWKENANAIQSGGHEGFSSVLRDAGRKSNVEWIDKGMKFNNEMLEKEDRLFLYSTFVSAASQFINAQKIDVDHMTHAQRNAIIEHATQQAQEATYRDTSTIADALNSFARQGWLARFLIESIMPFKKTPINIFKRGIEYSPASIFKGVYHIAQIASNKGTVSASTVCDELAKGIVGSGLMALGFFLSKAGILKRKAGRGDRDEKYEKDVGHQDYSIEIGDVSIKIEQLVPMTFPLFVGCTLEEYMRGEKDRITVSDVAEAIFSIGDPLMDMSFVSGINSALETYSENKIGGVLTNMITSFAGQNIPIIGSKFNNTISPRKLTTKADATSALGGTLDSTVRSWGNNIPFLGPLVLEPYVSTTGGYVEKNFGDYVLSFLNNFAFPTNVSIIDSSPINEEIARLVASTGEVSFVPQNPRKDMQINNETVKMNAKEYTEYSKDHNETVYAALEDAMNTGAYKKGTDEQKVNILKQAYDSAHTSVAKKYRAILISNRNK